MSRLPPIMQAAIWMSGWLLLQLVLAIAGRETTRELTVVQVLFIRSVIGCLMLLPIIMTIGKLSDMKSARPMAQISRNIVHYISQFGWLYALTLIPLGQLVSIEFTMPIWIAIMAAIFLGERITLPKVAAIVLGLIGVVIIVRPAMGTVNEGQLIALLTAFGFGISVILVKSLTTSDGPIRIIFWMTIIQGALGLVPALLLWRWPSAWVWSWLVVIAFCGTFSHFCMSRAMQHADATVVIPMDFLRVPLMAIVGWWLYYEGLDIYTMAGAALILAGNMLNLRAGATSAKPDTEKAPAR